MKAYTKIVLLHTKNSVLSHNLLFITYQPLTFYCFTMKKDTLRSFQVFMFTDQKTHRKIAENVNLHILF